MRATRFKYPFSPFRIALTTSLTPRRTDLLLVAFLTSFRHLLVNLSLAAGFAIGARYTPLASVDIGRAQGWQTVVAAAESVGLRTHLLTDCEANLRHIRQT